MPERIIVVCRELTKKFEEVLRGKAEELISKIGERELKGEIVVIISPLKWIEKEIEEIVLKHESSQRWLEGKAPKKIIIVPNKIINVVV